MTNNRDHLSKVQALCTNLSDSETELVLGSIYGLREWFLYTPSVFGDVYPNTRLVGHFGQPWRTDEPYEAACRAVGKTLYLKVDISHISDPEDIQFSIRTQADEWFEDIFSRNPAIDPQTARAYLSFSASGPISSMQPVNWLLDDPFMDRDIRIPPKFRTPPYKNEVRFASLKVVADRTAHAPGHPECTCGIYAYHDMKSLQPTLRGSYRSSSFGLVEASGYVTIGTKGFRAQRAKIIALTSPYPNAAVYGEVIQAAEKRWREDKITVLPDLKALLEFAERGGYLKKPTSS